ncbi:amidohydrolase [hydrothermal vent metagenome]|uniref:Amidohydrolase n=1 Tax=hydrothermal vent metagenome TaxID=652676 RepID=A0A3B0TF09_9ZZZZ
MRKIAASYIFPVHRPPIKNGIIVLDDDGTILDLVDTKGELAEQANLEYYNGILAPGFINAHCHLELSHLYKKIPEHLGLPGFIGAINKLRNTVSVNGSGAIRHAAQEMYRQGIIAVGDVSNSFVSTTVKKNSNILYHTFVEAFGFSPERAEKAFLTAEGIYKQLKMNRLRASISPHSPYSVSEPLFRLIKEHAESNNSIVSIHNQESLDENEFFQTGGGGIASHLKDNIGLSLAGWKPTGQDSLQSVLEFLPRKNHLLLVHNTYTTKAGLEILRNEINPVLLFFVICPNSNLYIENTLPPIGLFMGEKLAICLGTDSLASNHRLSILAEMVTLQQHFPDIPLNELLAWATINGAKALKMEDTFGTFELGKKPGINLLSGIDLVGLRLTPQSKVKRLA